MSFEKLIDKQIAHLSANLSAKFAEAWLPVEHEVWKKLKKFHLDQKEHFILAVSGGIDSIVLLYMMVRLKPRANFIVAHFHHGDSRDESTSIFRQDASDVVKKLTEALSKHGIHIEFEMQKHSGEELKSELDFRLARLDFLRRLQQQNVEAILVTGHQQNDLLETWLLKMIRGTGSEGLENFKFWNQSVLRPLLYLSKEDIVLYAEHNNLSWVEDPSNSESVFLRNWLRNEWLPELERKQPGSLKNITLSMARLLNDIDGSHSSSIYSSGIYSPIEIIYSDDSINAVGNKMAIKVQFSRLEYVKLDHHSRLKVLAAVLKRINCDTFSQNQLEEIEKRLDKNQKELTFSVSGANWVINAQQVVVHL